MARVLLVDDHPANLLTLEAILEPLGYELVQADSGEAALRHVLHGEFAVILLDVRMTGLDGFQTAALIKKRERSRHTPIIFLTAHADDPTRVFSGYAHGAVDYMTKPFDPEVLRSKVGVFVELWTVKEALRQKAELLETREEQLRQALAVTADESARLGADVRKATALQARKAMQQRGLIEAAVGLSREGDVLGVLRGLSEHALRISGSSRAIVGLAEWREPDAPLVIAARSELRGRAESDAPSSMRATANASSISSTSASENAETDERELVARALVEPSVQRALEHSGARWMTVPLSRSDGTTFGVLAVEHPVGETFTDDDGATLVQLAQLGAVTAQLRADEERFRMLLDSTAEGIWSLDREGRCTFANAASRLLLGLGPHEDVLGVRMHELTKHTRADGKPCPASECRILAVLEGGGSADVADEYFHEKSGRRIPVRYRCRPILREGSVVGAVVTFENIASEKLAAEERERLIAALERSNRELDQFAYVASHDLKAPLRGIANLSEWLEEDLGEATTPGAREHLVLLRGRCTRMENLINGILDYSRAGRVRARVETIDVGKLLQDTVELIAPASTATITIEPPMPTVRAMRVPFEQVFMNLIGNALKHGGPSAHVRISSREAGEGFVEFSVTDDGPGIAPEYHERIWGIFQTLEPRDKVEGAGIGLSVVRKIVESRGGRAWLDSDVGRGATFSFTWPTQQEEES